MKHVNLNDIWISAVVNHCQFGPQIKVLEKVFMKSFDASNVYLDGSSHGGQSDWYKYVVLSWITFEVYFYELLKRQ